MSYASSTTGDGAGYAPAIRSAQAGNAGFRQQAYQPSRNLVGIALVVLLHVAFIYALASGLGHQMVDALKGPLETKIIDQVKQEKHDLPPPPPKFAPPPPPFVPPPEVMVQQPAATSGTAISAVTNVRRVAPPPSAIPDREVSAKPIAGEPLVYPPRMLASGREGSVDVDCTVEANGRTSNCAVTNVSGGSAFADSAMQYVSSARYRPRVHNGAAVKEEHHTFHIDFKLQG